MRILTIASQKGGVGKTILAAYLAVAAEHTRVGSVAVIDTDPPGFTRGLMEYSRSPTPPRTASGKSWGR